MLDPVLYCWFTKSQYISLYNVCLYLYCSWKSSYRSYKVRIPLTGIILSHSITCPKPWPRFPVPCVDAFFVKRLEVKGGYSFCWYWWNSWPSLFKLLFIWLHLRRTIKTPYPYYIWNILKDISKILYCRICDKRILNVTIQH